MLPRTKLKMDDAPLALPDHKVFNQQILFTSPFIWTQQAGRNILIDITVHTSDSRQTGCTWCTYWTFDRVSGTASFASQTWTSTTPTVTRNAGLALCLFTTPAPVAVYQAYGAPCRGTLPRVATTLPAEAANRMARGTFSWLSVWLSSSMVGRVMMLYRGSDLGAGLVKSLGVRGYAVTSFTSATGGQQKIKLSLGHTGKTAATIDAVYANNIDSGPLTVVFDSTINLPPLQPLTIDPHDFPMQIPFAQAWVHVPQSGKNLLIDSINSSASGVSGPWWNADEMLPNSTCRWGFDANTASVTSSISPVISLEGVPGNSGPKLLSADRPVIGTTMSIDLVNARPTAVAALILGASNTLWGAIPLPLALPGGCELLASIDVMAGVVTTATGTASIKLAIPNAQPLIGVRFYNQYLVIDAANTLGIVFSDAFAALIGDQ